MKIQIMKTNLLQFLIFITLSFTAISTASAQSCSFTLNSQAEVDNFDPSERYDECSLFGYSEYELIINGSDITSLEGMPGYYWTEYT